MILPGLGGFLSGFGYLDLLALGLGASPPSIKIMSMLLPSPDRTNFPIVPMDGESPIALKMPGRVVFPIGPIEGNFR